MTENAVNILVAEDDYAIALALKTIIENNFECNLILTHNGQEAFDALHQTRFDLILSDWNMPVKTGYELLEDIKDNPKFEHIPFIMLTARADKDSVIDAARTGVTDYLHKPFDRQSLIVKLKELISNQPNKKKSPHENRNIVNKIAEQLKNDDFALPVMSDIANTVNNMLDKDNATVTEISEVIKNDPIITARLVALSNTAIYRRGKPNSTLEEAIKCLGFKETVNYLWVFSNVGLFESSNAFFSELLIKIRRHCMATAECARLIALDLKLNNSDELFYFGLMHDVGAVLVMQIIEELNREEPLENIQLALQAISQLHVKFGAVLLQRWGMPEKMQKVALYHEDLTAADRVTVELKIIHVSNALIDQLGMNFTSDNTNIDILKKMHELELDINEQQVETYKKRIVDYLEEMDNMMKPGQRVDLF